MCTCTLNLATKSLICHNYEAAVLDVMWEAPAVPQRKAAAVAARGKLNDTENRTSGCVQKPQCNDDVYIKCPSVELVSWATPSYHCEREGLVTTCMESYASGM